MKESLQILNLADYISIASDLFAVCIKAFDHISLKLLIFYILQVLRFEFLKFRILEIMIFHPFNIGA